MTRLSPIFFLSLAVTLLACVETPIDEASPAGPPTDEVSPAEAPRDARPVPPGRLLDRHGVALTDHHKLVPGLLGGDPERLTTVFAPLLSGEGGCVAGGSICAEEGRPHDVVLTLDLSIQALLHEALEATPEGVAVVIDPRDGRVLGLYGAQSRRLRHRALRAFPPGSLFKLVTALAALSHDPSLADATHDCSGAHQHEPEQTTFRCWKREGHGELALIDAIAESCDAYFYQTAETLGLDPIAAQAKALGLGEPTRLGMPEDLGQVPTVNYYDVRDGYRSGHALSNAIGGGDVLATPLQMAVAYAAIVHGVRFQPRIIAEVRDLDDVLVYQSAPQSTLGLSPPPGARELLLDGLDAVVQSPRGTASAFAVPDVAGKTATATAAPRFAAQSQDHAWFIGHTPARDPRFVVAVFIEHGGSSKHAASIALPILGALTNQPGEAP